MRNSKKSTLLVAALAGLGIASSANAAMIVGGLQLYKMVKDHVSDAGTPGDTSDDFQVYNYTLLVPSGGNVNINQGDHLALVATASVSTPNNTSTATTRATAFRNKPLGIAGFISDVQSSNPAILKPTDASNATNPDANYGAGQWAGYNNGNTSGRFIDDAQSKLSLDGRAADWYQAPSVTGNGAGAVNINSGVPQGAGFVLNPAAPSGTAMPAWSQLGVPTPANTTNGQQGPIVGYSGEFDAVGSGPLKLT